MKYQQEFLVQVQVEAEYLLCLHWEEIALNKDVIKLDPDWDAYASLEIDGKLKIFTARDNGKLVGYFVVIVGYNLHYKQHLFAANDIIYLHKDYRKGFAGINLIKFAESALKDDGVSVLAINTKVHQPFDPVLKRLGFSLAERVYSKFLKDK
jgi:GNAT superfamily N-acetyltransferase